MGWSNVAGVVLQATTVIISGGAATLEGIFVYAGNPATGNLILSVAAQAGTDPYGNSFPQGYAAFGTGILAGVNMVLNDAAISWTQSTWTTPANIFTSQPGVDPFLTIQGPASAAGQNADIIIGGAGSFGSLPNISMNAVNYLINVSTTSSLTITDPGGIGAATIQNNDSWTTPSFAANFTSNSANPFSYKHMPDGTVLFRGRIDCSVAIAANTTAFTLPVGYRASVQANGFMRQTGTTTPQTYLITTAGLVQIGNATTAAATFDFTNVRFPII